jgi:hypothetical protein
MAAEAGLPNAKPTGASMTQRTNSSHRDAAGEVTFHTVKETARYLRLCEKQVRRLISRGELPSDPDEASRTSIEAWMASKGLANVRAPVAIDVREGVWGVEDDAPFDAMISLNMVHIAPWEAALGLLAGGARLLRPDGVLFLYGPFMLDGKHTATTNAAFDADLKQRDLRWGVRDINDIVSEAVPHGLELREVVDMPANNLSLVLVKARPAHPT